MLKALKQTLHAPARRSAGAPKWSRQPVWFICFGERLADAGTEPTWGSKDHRHDNPLTETINRLYLAVPTHRGHWKSPEAIDRATLKRVLRSNHH